jgi:hypothetical protein
MLTDYCRRGAPSRVQIRGYCYCWEDDPFRKFALHENNFGWFGVLELKSEVLELLSLMASATSERRKYSGWILP